ncbi:hypothetical protein EDD86DRAFT_263927 [Gorgonomyces haynaldii]|nr:hypothetical protein EDD86DRAFT_263927 [Gorgonomyces haynaldii]
MELQELENMFNLETIQSAKKQEKKIPREALRATGSLHDMRNQLHRTSSKTSDTTIDLTRDDVGKTKKRLIVRSTSSPDFYIFPPSTQKKQEPIIIDSSPAQSSKGELTQPIILSPTRSTRNEPAIQAPEPLKPVSKGVKLDKIEFSPDLVANDPWDWNPAVTQVPKPMKRKKQESEDERCSPLDLVNLKDLKDNGHSLGEFALYLNQFSASPKKSRSKA